MLKHSDFVPGETVYHHRFGCGVVEEIDAKIAAVRFGKANLVRVLPSHGPRRPAVSSDGRASGPASPIIRSSRYGPATSTARTCRPASSMSPA